jgi:hypothetical protein
MSKKHPQNGPTSSKNPPLTKSQIERSHIEAEKRAKIKATLDPKYETVTPWDNHIKVVKKISQVRSGYIPASTPINEKLLVRRRKQTPQCITITLGDPDNSTLPQAGDVAPLSKLDMDKVHKYYGQRCLFSKRLNDCFDQHHKNSLFVEKKFIDLALGLIDPAGNNVAVKDKVAEKIRKASDSASLVFKFAKRVHHERPAARPLVQFIHEANIMHFNLFVGSEMAMMLCPTFCWATNLSVIWACEYTKHNFAIDRANEIIAGYSDCYRDRTAWDHLHLKLKSDLDKVGALAREPSNALRNIWNDAVAMVLFDRSAPDTFHGSRGVPRLTPRTGVL